MYKNIPFIYNFQQDKYILFFFEKVEFNETFCFNNEI